MKIPGSSPGVILFPLVFCYLLLLPGAAQATDLVTTSNQANQSRTNVDLIIAGDHIVTMDVDKTVYKDAAIAVDKGLIIAIGPASEIFSDYQPTDVLQGKNRVVMPGLVNGHSHAAMTLLRGVAEDLALMTWLNEYIFPAVIKFVDADFVRIGTELACWEMIRGGTTTFVDMYYYPDMIAVVARDSRCNWHAGRIWV